MAFTVAKDGTRLHFEVFGCIDGEPLLMIQGLGADARGWTFQRRALGSTYRCITFDNRGVGRSGKPPGPYDLEVMAADALTVLEAAGYDSAHVMGASMGGVIAQLIAVRQPHRVRSLVLACTACRHLPWRVELLEEWAEVAEEKGMGEFARHNLKWLLGPRSLHRIRPFLRPALGLLGPIAASAPAESFVAQVRAILAMDDRLRYDLAGIGVPTLVLVGSQDILTPVADSEELAELIPGARLEVIRGGAHGFLAEHAGAFNRAVCDFLADVAVPVDELPHAATA